MARKSIFGIDPGLRGAVVVIESETGRLVSMENAFSDDSSLPGKLFSRFSEAAGGCRASIGLPRNSGAIPNHVSPRLWGCHRSGSMCRSTDRASANRCAMEAGSGGIQEQTYLCRDGYVKAISTSREAPSA